jgi:pentatricopeptide repeat protein
MTDADTVSFSSSLHDLTHAGAVDAGAAFALPAERQPRATASAALASPSATAVTVGAGSVVSMSMDADTDAGTDSPVLYTTRHPAGLPSTVRLNESASPEAAARAALLSGLTTAPSAAVVPPSLSVSDAVFDFGLVLRPDAVSAQADTSIALPEESVDRAHRERVRDTLRELAAARRRGELRRPDGTAMTVREAAEEMGVVVKGRAALRRLEASGEVAANAIPGLPKQREVVHAYSKLLVTTLKDAAVVLAATDLRLREYTDPETKDVVQLPAADGETTAHLAPPVARAIEAAERVFNAFSVAAPLDATHYSMMMTMYGRVDMPIKAAAVFDALRSSSSAVADTVAYNAMLGIMVRNNKVAAACHLFEEMRMQAHLTRTPPDVVTYTTMLSALSKVGDRGGALAIFSQMRKDDIVPTVPAWTAVISAMCRAGDFKASLRLLHDMRLSGCVPSAGTYRTVAVGSCRSGHVKLFMALAEQMRHDGHAVDGVLISSVIRAFGEAGRANEALRVHRQLALGAFGPDARPSQLTYNALLETLADPHSWGRLTLSPLALDTGLHVLQEAILSGAFPFPYELRDQSGVLDLRPYRRGAVLFPIHMFLNLLVAPVLVPADRIARMPSTIPQVNRARDFIFSSVAIPRRGVLLLGAREARAPWSAAPKPLAYNTGTKLRTHQGEVHDPVMLPEEPPRPARDYIENVLRSTRPWIHHQQLPNNPCAVMVATSTLQFWVKDQYRRMEMAQQFAALSAEQQQQQQQQQQQGQQQGGQGQNLGPEQGKTGKKRVTEREKYAMTNDAASPYARVQRGRKINLGDIEEAQVAKPKQRRSKKEQGTGKN